MLLCLNFADHHVCRCYLTNVKFILFQKKHIMSRKADDNHSETSHDTTTSDSGRGGSEEDINSNRGHTLSDSGNLL